MDSPPVCIRCGRSGVVLVEDKSWKDIDTSNGHVWHWHKEMRWWCLCGAGYSIYGDQIEDADWVQVVKKMIFDWFGREEPE